jgi:hypothetical protein
MTHASVPAEQRALLGIDDSLIRLSVGVESCTDLIEDLKAALSAVTTSIGINGLAAATESIEINGTNTQ